MGKQLGQMRCRRQRNQPLGAALLASGGAAIEERGVGVKSGSGHGPRFVITQPPPIGAHTVSDKHCAGSLPTL